MEKIRWRNYTNQFYLFVIKGYIKINFLYTLNICFAEDPTLRLHSIERANDDLINGKGRLDSPFV